MFVYFIFYDDYDVHEVENDHQNVIQLDRSKSEEIINTKTRTHGSGSTKEQCTLCLEEIVKSRRNSMICGGIKENESKVQFIFRDYSMYNYNNSEYIHSCDCRPSLHSICFIDTYNKKHSCIICNKEIEWRYSALVNAKTKFFTMLRVYLLHGVYFSINISIIIS